MKRRKQFIGLFALAGVIALGVSSCKKYDDDIDQLRQEIADTKASLESALKAGKLITAVNPVADGWSIVFSDNSTITIKNGKDGAAGKTGFTPVIGIDKDGYWTVIVTEGGAATRIKDASGKDVKAVGSVPVANAETKTWWIDGKDTGISYVGEKGQDGEPGKDAYSPYIDKDSNHWMVYDDEAGAFVDSKVMAKIVYKDVKIVDGTLWIDGEATSATGIPSVAYNELTKTVMITVYDASGKATNYEFMQASDVMVMITSVSCPIAKQQITIDYGVAAAAFDWTTSEKYAQNALLLPNGKIVVPVIVNPAGASLEGCKVEIVTPNEGSFAVPVSKVTRGYDYDKYGFIAANAAGSPAANGLWSLELGLTAENLKALNTAGPQTNLAIKVTKGEGEKARVIYSGYQYNIKSNVVATLANLDDTPATATVALGETYNLLGATDSLKVFRSKSAWKTGGTMADADKGVITVAGTKVSTVDNAATIDALEGKTSKFGLTVRDFTGVELTKDVVVTYYSSIGLNDVTLPASNMVLHQTGASAASDTMFVSLDPVFTALGIKKELWITNATTFKAVIKNDKGQVVDADAALGNANSKFVANFFEHAQAWNEATGSAEAAVNSGANAKIKYVGINAVLAAAVPGSYIATITFADTRNASYKTFSIDVPFTVANPAISESFTHVPALWNGQNLAVYGAAQTSAVTYALATAYSKVPVAANFGFEYVQPTGGKPTPLADNKTINVSESTIYNPYTVDVYYYHFGNMANKVKVESIVVTPKSVVKEGALSMIAGKKFEAKIGGQTVKMSETFTFANVNAVAKAVFAALGDEIDAVSVEAVGDNAKIVTVAGSSGAEWTITTGATAEAVSLPAKVTIKVSITGKLGAKSKFEKELEFTVLPLN